MLSSVIETRLWQFKSANWGADPNGLMGPNSKRVRWFRREVNRAITVGAIVDG
ncbi:MAG: hypothetical protein ACI814_004548 [Mariniblastus sp.]|jgi:hypothetical protein